jgi:type IV pilus assembly protein PilP
MKPGLKFGNVRMCAAIAVLALTGGCVSNDISDLEKYKEEVLARKGGNIEPLPPIKPYEHYVYQALELGLRDPFKSFLEEKPEKSAENKGMDAAQQKYVDEIQTHNREELESYELDAMRMVGLLERTDDLWAIVKDQGGTVHRVQVGNYLGRNFGKITNIQEDRIDVREIIKDAQGRWQERAASLALSEE